VLYAAAHHKRGTHFGPSGPGAIYAIDLATGNVSTFAVVPNVGSDSHDPTDDFFPDLTGRFSAGRTSLGDLDISPDGTELAVVNLDDRRIYRFRVSDGELLGSFAHGAAQEPWASEDARPYGLGYRGDRLYHGVVRTDESGQNPDNTAAFVYESATDGGGMTLVASAGLKYDRGWVWVDDGIATWNPWLDPPGQVARTNGRYPMPMLSDIEFTSAADQMILGLRDRFGDETFYTTPPNSPPPGERIYNTPAGDIVAAWTSQPGWNVQTAPEFYVDDYGPRGNRDGHEETAYGGLAVLPGQNVVVSSANSPLRISSAGALWLSTESGTEPGREELYRFGVGDNFGKANGLGDVEVLCPNNADTPTPTLPPTASETPVTPDTPVPPTTGVPPTSTPVPNTATPSPSHTPPGPTPTGTLPTATNTVPATSPPDTPESPVQQPTPTIVVPKLPKTGGGPGGLGAGAVLFAVWLVLVAATWARRATDVRRKSV
jgi:hypothetical protein